MMSNQMYGTTQADYLDLFWIKSKEGVIASKAKDAATGNYVEQQHGFCGGVLHSYRIGFDGGNAEHKIRPYNYIMWRFAHPSEPDEALIELKMDLRSGFFGDMVNRLMPLGGEVLRSGPLVYVHVYRKGEYTNLTLKNGAERSAVRYEYAMGYHDPNYPGFQDHPFELSETNVGEPKRDYRIGQVQWVDLFDANIAPYLEGEEVRAPNPRMREQVISDIVSITGNPKMTMERLRDTLAPHILREVKCSLFNDDDQQAALWVLNEGYQALGGKGYFHLGNSEKPQANPPPSSSSSAPAPAPAPKQEAQPAGAGGVTAEDDLPF